MDEKKFNLPDINFKIDFDFEKIFNKIKSHFKGDKRGEDDTPTTEIKKPPKDNQFGNVSSKNILPNIINKMDSKLKDDCTDEIEVTKNSGSNRLKSDSLKDVDSLIGIEGLKQYHYEFKNYTRISKIISNKNKEKSPSRKYLSILEKYNLTPKPSGIISRRKCNKSSVNLNNFSLGDSYTMPLSEILKESKSLKKIKIAQNRITNLCFRKLIDNISYNINVLDLSTNNLSKESYSSIAKLLSNTSQKL